MPGVGIVKGRHLEIVYRSDKAYKPNASHIGLGVSAMHHVRVLRRNGVDCDAHAASEIADTIGLLAGIPADSIVVIEAFWLVTQNVVKLLDSFPRMVFAVRCHSQIGFLQVEPQAISLLREQVHLQDEDPRFKLVGNSARFTEFVRSVFGADCLLLPNLYDTARTYRRVPPPQSRLLRVGCFGALRNLKMHVTGAAAAMEAARRLGRDLELHITVGRDEGGGSVIASIHRLMDGLHWAKLVEHPWSPWPNYRRIVETMDICVQCSATETFNIVTADSLAAGVPCIVGPAIDWAPRSWIADIDDPGDIATKMIHAHHDPRSSQIGLDSLESYVRNSVARWMEWYEAQLY